MPPALGVLLPLMLLMLLAIAFPSSSMTTDSYFMVWMFHFMPIRGDLFSSSGTPGMNAALPLGLVVPRGSDGKIWFERHLETPVSGKRNSR